MKMVYINKFFTYRNLANYLTIIRAGLGLPIIILLNQDDLFLAWVILIIAGVTDGLDGYFARKSGINSPFGARLDPLADKILISAPILWLNQNGILASWAVWILFSRELLITNWRSDDERGGPASIQGKLKTCLQYSSIILMIWPEIIGGKEIAINLHKIGWLLFWPSLVFAFSSLKSYFKPQIILNLK